MRDPFKGCRFLIPGLLVITAPTENEQMGFTCAEVSLQYGDGMWLQLTPRIGAFKAFVNSPLFLQNRTLGGKDNQACDALQSRDAYCSYRDSMKNSERALASAFISTLSFYCYRDFIT